MRLSSFLSEVPQRLSHCKRRRCDEIIAALDDCHGQVQFFFFTAASFSWISPPSPPLDLSGRKIGRRPGAGGGIVIAICNKSLSGVAQVTI